VQLRGALCAAIDDEDDDRCTEIADLMVAVGTNLGGAALALDSMLSARFL
jgi:hypothetical protein